MYKKKSPNFKPIGLDGFFRLFSVGDKLREEINNFYIKKTRIYFHFIDIYKYDNFKYEKIKFSPTGKEFKISNNQEVGFEYEDILYPYKYNINEEIILIGKNNEIKKFLISINKHLENHYNIIINKITDKAFSLEIIYYSNIKEFFPEQLQIENIDKFIYEKNHLKYMRRFNIVNISLNDIYNIYCNEMEEDEKLKKKDEIFSIENENLLFNFILFKDKKSKKKTQIRRIFINHKEKLLEEFTEEQFKILEEYYNKVIKKHLNNNNNNNYLDVEKYEILLNDFAQFEKSNRYTYTFDNVSNDDNNLRAINSKFCETVFYLLYYNKKDIDMNQLLLVEYLCYLNIILTLRKASLKIINSFIKYKNDIFEKNNKGLSNKDKAFILLCILAVVIENKKENYTLQFLYNLSGKSPYIESELFYRKIISELNEDSNLNFLYIQLGSGSGIDLISHTLNYKIKTIPLIVIKNHLLNKYIYPYFFSYNHDMTHLVINSSMTLIKSYNEDKKLGYKSPSTLGSVENKSDMIKLLFLKFNIYGHSKFEKNFNKEKYPCYCLDENYEIIYIDDKPKNKKEYFYYLGESETVIEYYIFKDNDAVNKIIDSPEDLSKFDNIELYMQNNFEELRKIYKSICEDDGQSNNYKMEKKKLQKRNI